MTSWQALPDPELHQRHILVAQRRAHLLLVRAAADRRGTSGT
jgi:hypothetical protein